MGIAIMFAIALSLDGFGVGMSYGLRRIRIPWASMLMIAFCTVVAMSLAVLFGGWFVQWVQFLPPNMLGAIILLSLGIYQVVRALSQKYDPEEEAIEVSTFGAVARVPVIKFQFEILGIVIQVLRYPEQADLDGSGIITIKESALLGTALSLDAFASGLAIGFSSGIIHSFPVILLVALTQVLMLRIGQVVTGLVPRAILTRIGFLPGTLLILIGLGKLI
ncbi:sporulation membrane protein YtaF [Desulfitobacterium metallireducens]|uniref:Sporulation protein n=1 Tax=Desulfitobacterium metallireducens DSM 15288 TaxID=871968 RepID=W0E718_9FIRM|nr:sporulation membrane protein YtaF [Desulfitobacterium metallireducens]AHF06567.1 sporulation protein [Desulfitobacterium metallireducens DSM 15288]